MSTDRLFLCVYLLPVLSLQLYWSTHTHTHTQPPHYICSSMGHTIVSEPDTLPVKKSQKLLGGLLSSDVVDEALELCRTQMPLSLGLCGCEPLSCRPRLKWSRSSEQVCLEPHCLCSWSSRSSLWALEEDWARLRRLWWEWNCLILLMDLGGTSEEPVIQRTEDNAFIHKGKNTTVQMLKKSN